MRYATVQQGSDGLFRVSDSSYRFSSLKKGYTKKKKALKLALRINTKRKLAECRL